MHKLKMLDPQAEIAGADRVTVLDFWRWAYSDSLSNRNRSIFAEYIVGVALGAVDSPRVEWDSVDIHYGPYKIEVKSSADCQSWHQARPSRICFSIRKAVAWNADTGAYEGGPTRSADAYVFCHYPEKDKTRVNVLDVDAWDFYVVPVDVLNCEFGEAKSVSLKSVQRVGSRCKFGELLRTVDAVLAQERA